MIRTTGSFAIGFAMGFGTGVLTREIVPMVGEVVRPVTKAFMRMGVMVYRKGQASMAYIGESLEDMYAEVKAEAGQMKEEFAQPERKVTPKTSRRKLEEKSQGKTIREALRETGSEIPVQVGEELQSTKTAQGAGHAAQG